MYSPKSIALTGAALMALGVFLPMCRLPFVGSINFIHNWRVDGLLILLIAIITSALALSGRTRRVFWPGVLSLSALTLSFLHFQHMLSTMRDEMQTDLQGNPFAGLAELALSSVRLEWGWAVLLIAGLMVTYAGRSARNEVAGQTPSTDSPEAV